MAWSFLCPAAMFCATRWKSLRRWLLGTAVKRLSASKRGSLGVLSTCLHQRATAQGFIGGFIQQGSHIYSIPTNCHLIGCALAAKLKPKVLKLIDHVSPSSQLSKVSKPCTPFSSSSALKLSTFSLARSAADCGFGTSSDSEVEHELDTYSTCGSFFAASFVAAFDAFAFWVLLVLGSLDSAGTTTSNGPVGTDHRDSLVLGL